MLTVVLQLFHRFDDVGQRRVLLVLLKTADQFRLPAPAQLFQRRHVQVTIMEKRFQFRHRARHETAVLANRIAAHRRLIGRYELLEEHDQRRFGLLFRHGRRPDPLDQPAAAMGALVPCIHLVERFVRLVDGKHRTFSDRVQVHVGDDDGNFDDAVGVRFQPGHFQVDPHQVELVGALDDARGG